MHISATTPRNHVRAILTTGLLVLASCGGDGTGVDDGGYVPSSIRISAPTALVIGDTIRATAAVRNRGGRELPGVVPAVSVSISGRAVRLIASTVALVVDTGRVSITATSGTLSAEQVVTVGMPGNLELDFDAPASVQLGDSIPALTLVVRRDGVTRSDLPPLVTSSDSFTVEVRQQGALVEYRPLKPGVATLTATLGTRSVARTVRVSAARIVSFAFAPTPTVLDAGDIAQLTVVAFDVQGAVVDTSEVRYTIASGPGELVASGRLRALAPGRIVVRAEARGVMREDTLDVMPQSSFTISVRPGFEVGGAPSTIPPRLQVAIDRAVKRWRQVIREELPPAPIQLAENRCRNPVLDETVQGVLVHVRVPALGFGGILAQATACVLRPDGRTIQGFMEFNADVLDRISDETLFYVAAHELGHVLGIGTIWYRSDGRPSLVTTAAGRRLFVGPQAAVQFDALDNRGTYTGPVVPLSADGGHWSPTVLMLELMEPISRASTRFSRVTVGAMADMGYVVNMRSWDRYALSLPSWRFAVPEPAFDLTHDVLPPFGVVQADGRVIPFR